MKYNYNFDCNEYKTPKELYQKALSYFDINKFSLDVCCSEPNIPAENHYYKGQKDGLKEDWSLINWCNPPFNECPVWVKKAYNEQKQNKKVALLIPARTETKYWHDFILNNKKAKIEFLRKGYRFLDKNNNEMGIFKNALALVYLY